MKTFATSCGFSPMGRLRVAVFEKTDGPELSEQLAPEKILVLIEARDEKTANLFRSAPKLLAALEKLVGDVCQCNTEIDKETGAHPSESAHPKKNAFGDYVWGDVCDYCEARRVIAQAHSKILITE